MSVWRPPSRFKQIFAPAELVEETLGYLAQTRKTENIAYWAGTVEGANARVTRVLKPAAIRRRAFLFVTVEEVARVVEECHQRGDFLVTQIHTHPRVEDHSDTDDCGTVSKRNGFVSLVVPFYGQRASVRDPGWFGYELRDRVWLPFDVARRIVIEQRI